LNERVLSEVNGSLGDALGQLYVAEVFPPEAKAQIEELVQGIIAAFRVRLEQNAWMTPATRTAALDKLAKIAVKVGYPDRWQSYAAVQVGDSYAETSLNAYNAEVRRRLARAGQPVDRTEWGLPPQTVNAFYSALANEIVFPAGILQPPFFDYQADPASNYGAIGFVIAHEITHGFDLQGSQFDAQGNLSDWWQPEDYERFGELNRRVAGQYGAIEVLPGVTVNGQITVTENVADLGGVQVAYDALQHALAGTKHPVYAPVTGFDSLTPDQRFFIAAASTWRAKTREAFLVTLIRVDVHSPASVRGVQPLRNMDAFYQAFDIRPGDPMYLAPEDRVVVW
jgi:putative endopeptidase